MAVAPKLAGQIDIDSGAAQWAALFVIAVYRNSWGNAEAARPKSPLDSFADMYFKLYYDFILSMRALCIRPRIPSGSDQSATPWGLAEPIDNRRCLAGRLNPEGALNLVTEGGLIMSESTLAARSEAPLSDSLPETPLAEPKHGEHTAAGGAPAMATVDAVLASKAIAPQPQGNCCGNAIVGGGSRALFSRQRPEIANG